MEAPFATKPVNYQNMKCANQMVSIAFYTAPRRVGYKNLHKIKKSLLTPPL